jgi:hypothetical protein
MTVTALGGNYICKTVAGNCGDFPVQVDYTGSNSGAASLSANRCLSGNLLTVSATGTTGSVVFNDGSCPQTSPNVLTTTRSYTANVTVSALTAGGLRVSVQNGPTATLPCGGGTVTLVTEDRTETITCSAGNNGSGSVRLYRIAQVTVSVGAYPCNRSGRNVARLGKSFDPKRDGNADAPCATCGDQLRRTQL